MLICTLFYFNNICICIHLKRRWCFFPIPLVIQYLRDTLELVIKEKLSHPKTTIYQTLVPKCFLSCNKKKTFFKLLVITVFYNSKEPITAGWPAGHWPADGSFIEHHFWVLGFFSFLSFFCKLPFNYVININILFPLLTVLVSTYVVYLFSHSLLHPILVNGEVSKQLHDTLLLFGLKHDSSHI